FTFDVLALDGDDLRDLPQRERRAVLERIVRPGDPVLRLVHSCLGDPADMVESVNELGLEGVVAKWAGARYTGGRSSLWRKLVLRGPERGWRPRIHPRPSYREHDPEPPGADALLAMAILERRGQNNGQ